ncbi:conserved exported hypothetical protein [Pseudomonas sp. 8AS]|uniref:translation initiation factor 2 (IF-2, GTPase) n=1 Tax=Pseudomonas sp. 8AS TaxID=2653163 RepID=UPI0012F30157|nr:translation initiation factor 2 (IF-2, GTPase) [Pseudomonas sp. 8AS]VXC41602.1 conserved exported hypothetical protein [Pseudomonas sp. 8AS]
MHTGPLSLLLIALTFAPWLAAEELLPATTAPDTVTAPEPSPAPGAMPPPLDSTVDEGSATAAAERESALLGRLRQENQRLKLKLKESLAQQPEKLLSEQQTWFAVGAGTALLAFVVGRLSGGRRNKRQSQWV